MDFKHNYHHVYVKRLRFCYYIDFSGWADFQPFSETKYPTSNVKKLLKSFTDSHRNKFFENH